MRRSDLLAQLLACSGDLESIVEELATFTWDSEQELVTLGEDQAIAVLARYLDGAIAAEEVAFWADSIEGREDIGFASELLKEFVFELANPAIANELNHETAENWIEQLSPKYRA